MFSTEDTIVAIATPPGRGGIGVVRISGPGAHAVVSALTARAAFRPRHATLAPILAADASTIDRAIVTYFPSPQSYTGEDVAEISAHGSPVVLEAIVAEALRAGSRLANPGEFTLRAYLNGRIDLVQAEAVADLIDAVTPLQARVAADHLDGTLTQRIQQLDAQLIDLIARLEASLDFAEDGYHFIAPGEAAAVIGRVVSGIDALLRDAHRGRMIREGFTAAIAGRPNVGKSSLFNTLAGAGRAIVTDVPGTTRDLLTERVDLAGVPLTLVDTAGVRLAPGDAVEEEGIARARSAAAAADLVVLVLDSSQPLTDEDELLLRETADRARVVVASKSDLPAAWTARELGAIGVSALSGDGVDALRASLASIMDVEPLRDRAAIVNLRHATLMSRARAALAAAGDAAAAGVAEEFVLADLHDARAAFDEVVGVRTADDVLHLIFARFCIGK